MASTVGNRHEPIALRSSSKFAAVCRPSPPTRNLSNTPDTATTDNNHHLPLNRQDQNRDKNQKQCTALPNNEVPLALSTVCLGRRVTRSQANSSMRVLPDLECQAQPPQEDTPKGQNLTPLKSQEPIVAECEESSPREIIITGKKTSRCPSDHQFSPYGARKSYRKSQKRQMMSIPYRKCHDHFEGRIVGLLNKVEAGKNCLREMEGLVEKLQKLGSRDLLNRHVVAGVKVLLRLARERDFDQKTVSRLEDEEVNLKERIDEELDRCDQFMEEQQVIGPDCREHRSTLIRRLYRVMKHRYPPHCRGQAKEHAVTQIEGLLQQERTVEKVIELIKSTTENRHFNIL